MSKTAPHVPLLRPAPFPWAGLITLSSVVFLSVTSEMLPTGLRPEMSRDLDVTQSRVGLLVSWFAFTVVLTSTPLAHLTRRLPRHGLIVAVLIAFALSNVLTAIAPTYEFLVASRVFGGMAHGLFWAVVGAYAAHLVPKEQIGRAVSITIAGGTVAFVFGIPVATAAGQLLGWRMSFTLLAALMLVGAVLVWRLLPEVEHFAGKTDAAASLPAGLPAPRRDPTVPAVALICTITAVIMIGHFTFHTYIAPFLIDGLGVRSADVAPLLFLYGIAGMVGLIVAGTVFGPRPQQGLVISLLVSAVSVTVLALSTAVLPVAIAAFLLWGLAFGTLPPLMQTRLLHAASLRIRDTASAVYTTAFNTGIGGGALLGAVLLDTVGLEVMPFVYVGILLAALTLVIVSERVIRRRTAP